MILNYTEAFKRSVITDGISKSKKMNSQAYYIGKRSNSEGIKLSLACHYSIELNLIDSRPSLSFTYPAKDKFYKELNINLKKGDKLYFSDGNAPFLELEIIKAPHACEQEEYKTVDLFILEKDIESLINNKLEEIIIISKHLVWLPS